MSKPKTIGYSQTYPIGQTGQFQKIWIELELDFPDDPRTELYKCKKIVNDFFYESNKAAEKQNQEQKVATLDEDGATIAGIMLCNDLVSLKDFELLSGKNKTIKAAYNQKLKQLQNGLEQY